MSCSVSCTKTLLLLSKYTDAEVNVCSGFLCKTLSKLHLSQKETFCDFSFAWNICAKLQKLENLRKIPYKGRSLCIFLFISTSDNINWLRHHSLTRLILTIISNRLFIQYFYDIIQCIKCVIMMTLNKNIIYIFPCKEIPPKTCSKKFKLVRFPCDT